MLIVGTKMIDAFADVFEGQLQKEHRLDLAGISMTIRMAVTTLLCLGLLMVTRQLMVACGCMFLGAVFVWRRSALPRRFGCIVSAACCTVRGFLCGRALRF
ncbi:MAG: hypothetical protein ACLR4A_03120 [Christensenellales bacterium]